MGVEIAEPQPAFMPARGFAEINALRQHARRPSHGFFSPAAVVTLSHSGCGCQRHPRKSASRSAVQSHAEFDFPVAALLGGYQCADWRIRIWGGSDDYSVPLSCRCWLLRRRRSRLRHPPHPALSQRRWPIGRGPKTTAISTRGGSPCRCSPMPASGPARSSANICRWQLLRACWATSSGPGDKSLRA